MPPAMPALNQLRCFEAAARHESFTLAADELCLTPSAVSHQIRTLETALNVDLFVRLGRKMYLSEPGRRYLADIQPAFAMIEAGTRRLQSTTSREVLTIGAAPSFAEAWLMPNLARFIASHPEIEVRLVTAEAGGEPERHLDCEIRYGHGKWVGLKVEKIAEDTIVPLASPALARELGNAKGVERLVHLPLIHTESRHFSWDQWFRSEGYPLPVNPTRLRVDRSPLAIKAAVNNLGVALESRILAAREIRDGALIPLTRLCRSGRRAEETYFLVRSHSRGSSARVTAFVSWIRKDFSDAFRSEVPVTPSPGPARRSPRRDPDSAEGREAR